MDLRASSLLITLCVVALAAPVQAKPLVADSCLGVAAAEVTADAWAQISQRVQALVAQRSALFPSPSIEARSHEALPGAAAPSLDLDIDAGHDSIEGTATVSSCLEPGLEWTARFRQTFLQAGADRMLLEAPTTPGIESAVDIEWFAEEDRLRTVLVFAGPLDIPNGTCWIDDTLSIDAVAGTAVASGQRGVKTSPFAEGACGRFFEHLPDGGAGEQAVSLFPHEVTLADGSTIRFVATRLSVTDAEIMVGGTLELR